MSLLTKMDIKNMAFRLRNTAQWSGYRQSERKDMEMAAETLLALVDLVSVDWPIAVGE